MVTRAVGRLADQSAKAVDTLVGLLGAESESARLGAARSILELGTKLRESTEIEERLAALEQKAKERAHKEKQGNGFGKR
jgi:flagellar motility protein MotE (MotC chaperone)